MRFEIFSNQYYTAFHAEAQSAWYWRLRARNGRIVADGGEGYASKRGCRRAINNLINYMYGLPLDIVEVES
jgi:uncharacterized protein YegP (UPF0339 family)